MEITWIAIAASLLMGAGALLIFIWAVKSQLFRGIEDVKYQIFWSDPERPGGLAPERKKPNEEQGDGSSNQGG